MPSWKGSRKYRKYDEKVRAKRRRGEIDKPAHDGDTLLPQIKEPKRINVIDAPKYRIDPEVLAVVLGVTKTIYVQIRKVDKQKNPVVPTPKASDFVCGQDNGEVSLPLEYKIEGWLLNKIEVGKQVRVHRLIRNGIKAEGYFETSPVTKVSEFGFETANSVYRMSSIEEVED